MAAIRSAATACATSTHPSWSVSMQVPASEGEDDKIDPAGMGYTREKPLANGASCLSCYSPGRAPTAIPSNRPHQSEPANRSF